MGKSRGDSVVTFLKCITRQSVLFFFKVEMDGINVVARVVKNDGAVAVVPFAIVVVQMAVLLKRAH
jgi:hypothetical protein